MRINNFIRGRTGTSTRLFVAFATVVFGGALFGVANIGAASAASKTKTVTLQYWSTYNTADKEASTIAKVLIPKFERLNPGIKGVSTIYPYADLLNKFIATS